MPYVSSKKFTTVFLTSSATASPVNGQKITLHVCCYHTSCLLQNLPKNFSLLSVFFIMIIRQSLIQGLHKHASIPLSFAGQKKSGHLVRLLYLTNPPAPQKHYRGSSRQVRHRQSCDNAVHRACRIWPNHCNSRPGP